jgi:exonuclease SbcC
MEDLTSLDHKFKEAQALYENTNQLAKEANTLYENNKYNLEQYIKINDKINEKAHEAFMLSRLSDVANGHVVGQERIDFETYYQSQVFGNILNVASKKLNIMTDGTYTMKRHIYNEQDGTKSTSLDVDIFDTSTGKTRSSKSLSGGETFMTALSLALGFAEVIRNEAGARELDCMFIDEGFGSLDNDSLHLVLNVLKNLSNQNSRMIGLISHVEELGYEINNKINVSKDANGSHLDVVCK